MNTISRRASLAAVVAAVALLLAGCGGSGDSGGSGDGGGGNGEKTFSDDRFALTFSYPDDLRSGEITSVDKAVGTSEADVAIGLDSDNLITISKFELNAPVTSANIATAASEGDGVIAELVGHPVHGEVTEIAGLPAVSYEAIPLDEPAQGESRMLFVFDNKDQYQIDCQSTPEKRAELHAACDHVLGSLRRT
jgi:hypothetical protein